jgi:cell division protein FtsW (lipid II flippase)
MKIKLSAFGIISLVLLSILLISDFFPNNPIFSYINNGYVFWVLLVALALFILLDSRYLAGKNNFQYIILPIYIVLLLVVLTLLNGESAHGFAANQSVFWIVALLCTIDIISFRKGKNPK